MLFSKSLLVGTLTLTTSLVSAVRHSSKRSHQHQLSNRGLLDNVVYLQNVLNYEICTLAASGKAAVDAILGQASADSGCVLPLSPAQQAAASVTPVAQLAAVPQTTTTITTTSTNLNPLDGGLNPTSVPSSNKNGTTTKTSAAVYATGTAKAITPSVGPHFLLYSDKWENQGAPPPPNQIDGWTVFALSFWLVTGPADMAQGWVQLTSAQRTSLKSQYAAAGIKLITAAFGSTDQPTTSGYDPVDTANRLAQYVIDYNLDGADIDYEDFPAMENNAHPGIAEQWLITFTTQLRSRLPSPQYIITHAPVAPWLTYNENWSGGGYLAVNAGAGKYIDWYNVQFYDQGDSEYTNCTTLLYTASVWPESALFQIAANGVPLSKLILGKPAIAADATNGYIPTAALAACVRQAQQQGYQGGLALWEYPDNIANYVQNIWGTTS